jgi:peptidoglycan hydrolase-like protein with peptidoglycan-binding domain
MIRTLALASALMAASLSARTLAAQANAPDSTKHAAAPAMNRTSSTGMQADTGAKAMSKTATSTKTKSATAHHAAWSTAQVKEAQEGLAKAGFYKGKPTGVVDKSTKNALRAYQKQNKLPVTGKLSDSVLVKLKSA